MYPLRAAHLLIGLLALQICTGLALGEDDEQITFRGKAVLADGAPAGGAIVERQGFNQHATYPTTADPDGSFAIRARFEQGVKLHLRSADDSEHATYTLSAPEVRAKAQSVQTIALAPARTIELRVTSGGIPVNEAEVVALGQVYCARGTTDDGGRAIVHVPAADSLRSVAAFHPSLGVGGQTFNGGRESPSRCYIELCTPVPYEIHVIDDEGQPVANLEFGVEAVVGGAGLNLSPIRGSHVRTNIAGVARLDWAPRDDLARFEPSIYSDQWKTDELYQDRAKERIVTQRLLQLMPVFGRVILPDGADPTGILVAGAGDDLGSRSALAYARAAADGSFKLMVPSDHGFLIGVLDAEWACEPWSGSLQIGSTAEQVRLELYPATTLTVRVARGPDRKPVPQAYVQVRSDHVYDWSNREGQRVESLGSIGYWLLTDKAGTARTGLGRGEYQLRLSAGEWEDVRAIEIKSAGGRTELEFHRPWTGRRTIAGRLDDAGRSFQPSANASIMAWTVRSPQRSLAHAPRLLGSGEFELEFDTERATVLFFDQMAKRCGLLEIGPQDLSATLSVGPTAAYTGTLLDSADRPIADQEIYLAPATNPQAAITTSRTMANGRFYFDAVPSQVALVLRLRDDRSEPRLIAVSSRYFEPGEVRENDRVTVRDPEETGSVASRSAPPLARELTVVCRDAMLSSMRTLVVLEGGESPRIGELVDGLEDTDATPDVLAYQVVRVSPDRAKAEVKEIAARNWPMPGAGEVVLLVFKEPDAPLSHARLDVKQFESALAEGRRFLAAERPPRRDALALYAVALKAARARNKRIWIALSRPRCGPCILLARWMDDQDELLKRDYVLLKVMHGLDANAESFLSILPDAVKRGVPYHAIVDASGRVLITSDGPLGNIGFPHSVEGARHLQRMLERTSQRLSASDIAALVESLQAVCFRRHSGLTCTF